MKLLLQENNIITFIKLILDKESVHRYTWTHTRHFQRSIHILIYKEDGRMKKIDIYEELLNGVFYLFIMIYI